MQWLVFVPATFPLLVGFGFNLVFGVGFCCCLFVLRRLFAC